MSVKQFLIQAATEKVPALKARGHLAKRALCAMPGDLGGIVAKAGMAPPIPVAELPKCWPDSRR